jgi:biotin carboxyl carrier protein
MTKPKFIAGKEQHESNSQKLFIDDVAYTTTFNKKFLKRKFYQAKDPKQVIAFIPGKIKKINVKRGSKVKEGDSLLILEAMKMNNLIFAPMKGIIKEVYVTQGISVAKDALLLEFK